MSAAFDAALSKLGSVERNDPAAMAVASHPDVRGVATNCRFVPCVDGKILF